MRLGAAVFFLCNSCCFGVACLVSNVHLRKVITAKNMGAVYRVNKCYEKEREKLECVP